jgi:hypothetical protein
MQFAHEQQRIGAVEQELRAGAKWICHSSTSEAALPTGLF